MAEGTDATGRLRLGILVTAASFAAGVGLTATAAWLIARASQMPPMVSLGLAIAGVRAFGVARPVLRYLGRLISHDGALRLVADCRAKVFEQLIPLAPGRLGGRHRGEVLASVVSDVDAVQDLHLRIIEPAAVAALVSAGCVGLATVLLPSAGAVLLVGLCVAGIAAPAAAASAQRSATTEIAPLRAALTARVVDLVRGAPELIVFGSVERVLAEIEEADTALTRIARRAAWATGLGSALAVLAAGASVWGSTVVCTPAVHNGTLSGVTMAVIVLMPPAAFESLAPLPTAAILIGGVRSSARHLFGILDEKPSMVQAGESMPLPEAPFALDLRDVSAKWTPNGPKVLNGLSLGLRPGEHVAITGRSGSGKTTLALLLLRFLDPKNDNTVLLNGVAIQRFAAEDIRRVIGYVADDAHIFASDVRENLRLARPEATDDELVAALRRVRLGEWFDNLPEGLSTSLGDRGALLSGGERRRIALARSVLADQPILILDEPTEGLDTSTATRLIADLLEAAKERTVVLLTHRPEGLDLVHRRFALVDGRLLDAAAIRSEAQ
jgi:thiol reductant ABC exporter CydC subunit